MHAFRFFLLLFMVACSSGGPDKAGTQSKPSGAVGGIVSKTESDYSLELVPQPAVRGSLLHAIPRNFNLSDGQIEWTVNGASVSGAVVSPFKASDVKKGDVVQVIVTLPGATVASNSVEIKNSPPEITSLKLMPEIFKPGDRLYADVDARDPDGDPVTVSYDWLQNGQSAGTGREIAAQLKRGDKISLKVIPFDGADYGTPFILEREILNLPPTIMEYKEYSFDGTIYTYQVKAADPDGDALAYSLGEAPNGMTIDPATGLVQWKVPPEFKGQTGMTVNVDDAHGGTARYKLTITLK
jgi:hypothetical protein